MSTASWSDKHFPKTIDEYVFTNEQDKQYVQNLIKQGSMQHCLFHGRPGTGKTTLAKLIPMSLGVHESDIQAIDATLDFSKSYVSNHLQNFMYGSGSTSSPFRVVIIDEADHLNKQSQKMLMGLITKWGKLGLKFCICCNNDYKLDAALHSRCSGGSFCTNNPDPDAFFIRLVQVLQAENIPFAAEDVEAIQIASCGQIRDAINLLQRYSITGTLILPP